MSEISANILAVAHCGLGFGSCDTGQFVGYNADFGAVGHAVAVAVVGDNEVVVDFDADAAGAADDDADAVVAVADAVVVAAAGDCRLGSRQRRTGPRKMAVRGLPLGIGCNCQA